jgi:nucleoside-diphosphate-sugar epimerase
MNVLLTGAFGNVGRSTLEALIERGHRVRCFDLKTRANRRTAAWARQLKGDIEVVWGDLRCPSDVAAAVQGQDVVVHLAFIIPKMSATGVESEKRPDWARKINIGGTRHLLHAMSALDRPPKLIFSSSYHIYGRTQDKLPPRTVTDPIRPTQYYSHHKAACERLVKLSGLEYAIFRLSATLPLAIQLDPGMFDVPLSNRMEFVHTRDVGIAIANGVTSDKIWGKTLLIGGGRSCQYTYREIVQGILEALGVGMLPEEAFGSTPFPTDWVDSTESQRLLHYQRRDLRDYVAEMVALLSFKRRLIRWFRPLVRGWLLLKSPHFWRSRFKGASGTPAPSSAG